MKDEKKIMSLTRNLLSLFFTAQLLLLLTEAKLSYHNITSDPRALCNDFTRAGIFLKKVSMSKKWIIFLESGGFCFSPESCNKRFFHPSIRKASERKFNPKEAWDEALEKGTDLSDVISPLMTSTHRYRNRLDLFPEGLVINGTDILNQNCEENPHFCGHNHMVLPYCSSDLWLGNDTRNIIGMETEDEFYSRYQPDSSSLQFVFRGAIIFRGAIQDLRMKHRLDEAEEILLVGSSAGGVGVFNHALWLKKELKTGAMVNISVIIDSGWFINFRSDLHREFSGFLKPITSPSSINDHQRSSKNDSSEMQEDFFSIIEWHEPCREVHENIPCCVSLHCLAANEHYYSRDIPLFVVVSLYDVFLLGASLRGLAALVSESEDMPGYSVDFLRTVAEYGGEMNHSIAELEDINKSERSFFSYYATGCFQHIYLATSTLWGNRDSSLFGQSLVQYSNNVGLIRHTIKKDVWNTFNANRSDIGIYTIKDAIGKWYQNQNKALKFHDSCQGPHCNNECPEMFILDELQSDNWLPGIKVLLVLVVIGVVIACVVVKVIFLLWLWKLEWKQQLYLGLLGDESYTTDIETALQFPDCADENAISVACLELRYSVKIRPQMKDERKDTTAPIVLSDLTPDDELDDAEYNLEGTGKEEEEGVSNMDEGESEKEGEGGGDMERRYSSKYEKLKRAKTRKTLRQTYKNYHHEEGTDLNQPEAIRKLRNIAQKTFRGSIRGKSFMRQRSGHQLSASNSSLTVEAAATLSDESNKPTSPKTEDKSLPSPSVEPFNEGNNSSQSPSERREEAETASEKEMEKNGKISESKISFGETEVIGEKEPPVGGIKISLKGRGLMMARQRTSLRGMKYRQREEKEILKGISLYFNPGELIGIMGPSGCGKTTFLDLLTGRRHSGTMQGNIYVNGVRVDEVHDWYISNTGYVLQLATPYYEELTVRENLTLAAQMKLSNSFSLREKFQRVEQVMFVSGLLELAETSVGGATGPGLSGGQKRRLAIALQLLKLPSVIFLDEPTSGLDAAASFELLSHLNQLADSNRTVILTIHQPRLEIFHMFHRLVLLSDGKVAYHGAPERAYEVFVHALKTRYLEEGFILPELEDHNPADVIMDMLGNSKMRQIITAHYQSSKEPTFVRAAIDASIVGGGSQHTMLSGTSPMNSITERFNYAIYGAKKVSDKHASIFYRLSALQARASKRLTWGLACYLPVIFFVYGFLLGTAYFQKQAPALVMSGFCVYSVASALFMFPILFNYYNRALEVYSYEHGDGIGNPIDLIIQGFVNAISWSAIPVVICAGVLYLFMVNAKSYNFLAFGQIAIVNLALNQCWTSILITLICAFPQRAPRLSPILSSVAGFVSGFFIPIHRMHWGYRWLFYLNPNYYGFSASAFFLLRDFKTRCNGSRFECYPSSGQATLKNFSFDDVNPYLHILILILFTIFYFFMAILSNWLRKSAIVSNFKRVKEAINRQSEKQQKSEPSEAGKAEGDTSEDEDSTGDDDDFAHFEDVIQGYPPRKLSQASAMEEVKYDDMTEFVGSFSTEAATSYSAGSVFSSSIPTLGPIFEDKSMGQRYLMGEYIGLESSTVPSTSATPRRVQFSVPSSEEDWRDSAERRTRLLSVGEESGDAGQASCLKPARVRRSSNQPSPYLHGGEEHHVWKPSSSSRRTKKKKHSLAKEKSNIHLLADRKKNLENRLHATREVLKLQNERIIGDVGSRPMTFTEATKKVSASITTSRKQQAQHFHSVVDQLVKMRSCRDMGFNQPMFSPATGNTTPVTPARLHFQFSPQSPKTKRESVTNAPRGIITSPKSPTTTSPVGTPPLSPQLTIRAVPIDVYRKMKVNPPTSPVGAGGSAALKTKHPLEKSKTEVTLSSVSPLALKRSKTQFVSRHRRELSPPPLSQGSEPKEPQRKMAQDGGDVVDKDNE